MTSDYSGPLKPTPDKPEKKIERVTSSEAVTKQKPLGRKFKEVFFGGDAKHAVRYVIGEVLLPGIRNMMFDSVTKGAERVLFGESPLRRPSNYSPRTQYHSPLIRQGGFMPDPRSRVGGHLPNQNPYQRARKDSIDIILAEREEAQLVVERLIDIVDTYDSASVADLYELVGLPATPTDNKWGWMNLVGIQVRQTREGFLIDLPPMEAL